MLKPWRNFVNVIRAHEFCVCFDTRVSTDDGYRTANGNRLMNTRPPWLIIYDRNPGGELLSCCNDDVIVDGDDGVPEEGVDEGGDASGSGSGGNSVTGELAGESSFSQAFVS